VVSSWGERPAFGATLDHALSLTGAFTRHFAAPVMAH
jgi:hypothetical protein